MRGSYDTSLYLILLAITLSSGPSRAQTSSYADEQQYFSALAGLGYTAFQEGFEDDADWSAARNPAAAASILSRGIIWTSNHPEAVTRPSRISTGSGAARTGSYGVYSLPHGDPDVTTPTGRMRDGLMGARPEGATPLYGVGLWLTGFPGSRVRLIFDGDEAGSVEAGPVDVNFRFFGVVVRKGFRKFEVRETEGTREDQKYIFADDFTLAVNPGDTGVFTSVSCASYAPPPLAPGSIASGFGYNLSDTSAGAPPGGLPSNLSGSEVRLTDSAGATHTAPLFYVSPGQINYLLPETAALGTAQASVFHRGQRVAAGSVRLTPVAPALFSANADGKGVAAAFALRVRADNSEAREPAFQCGAAQGSCVPAPLDLGPESDRLFLELYGTGIRRRSSQSAVSVTVGGVACEVLYAGPQGGFLGLDQVNVAVPRSLAGRGEMDVALVVDGLAANPVRIHVR